MPFSSHTCFTMPKSPYFLRQMALRVSPRIMVYDVGCVAVCVVPVVPVAVPVGNASGGVTSDHGMPSAEFPVVVPVVAPVVAPFAVTVLPPVAATVVPAVALPFIAVPAALPSPKPVV